MPPGGSIQRAFTLLPSAVACLLAIGCHGVIGGAGELGAGGAGLNLGGSSPDGGVTPPAVALAPPSPCTSNAPGPRKLWRLSGPEFVASIRSIFDDTTSSAPIGTVFSDPTTLGFSIDANGLLVQGLNASQLEDNAEAVAAWAANNGKLPLFASCSTQTTACGTQFVQDLGRRVFRTTLGAADPRVASYTSLFMSGSSFSDGAQAVIAAMLQSPYFLYRTELGAQSGGTFTLTPYEVATELAYLLTGDTPDDTLLAAADSVAAGDLALASMIDQQAQRLLSGGNPTAVMGFMNGWLGLPRLYTTAKDATLYTLTAAMQDNMATESQDLIMEAFNGNGSFADVLTADHSFLNKDLADFYGISSNGLSSTFVSVPYAGTSRDPGLLATGTILNGYARPDTDSPTQRGHMVRSRLLCQDIPPPPPNLDTMFKPSTTAETTRDHFVNEHSVGVCYTCHQKMDWIGFAFENYDGFGRYRTTENGLPVNDGGTIYLDPEGNSPTVTGLSGAGSLSAYLAESDDVRRCMSRYWSYYAFGSSTWSQDACTYDAIYHEAASNSFALKSVLMAIVHAPNFTSRVQDQ
jgi:uncharacterized protein DUF1592/uncharacterized protein DUF1588/uncharacterized protein DUF1595/uncharacterized protein DUF1585